MRIVTGGEQKLIFARTPRAARRDAIGAGAALDRGRARSAFFRIRRAGGLPRPGVVEPHLLGRELQTALDFRLPPLDKFVRAGRQSLGGANTRMIQLETEKAYQHAAEENQHNV